MAKDADLADVSVAANTIRAASAWKASPSSGCPVHCSLLWCCVVECKQQLHMEC